MVKVIELVTGDNTFTNANVSYIVNVFNKKGYLQHDEGDKAFFENMLGYEIAWKNIRMARILTWGMIVDQHPKLLKTLKNTP